MKLTILLLAAFLAPLIGQEAKIMILELPDSQRLAKAYREYKDAQAKWESVKTEVAKKYTFETVPTGITWQATKEQAIAGWEKVQFSADFRAIVPESSPYAGQTTGRLSLVGSGTTTTFAIPATTSTNLLGRAAGTISDLDVDHGPTIPPDPWDGVRSDLTVREK